MLCTGRQIINFDLKLIQHCHNYAVPLVSLTVKNVRFAASISLYDRKLNLRPYIRGVTN